MRDGSAGAAQGRDGAGGSRRRGAGARRQLLLPDRRELPPDGAADAARRDPRGAAPCGDAAARALALAGGRARGGDRATGRTPTASTAPSRPSPRGSRRDGSGSRASGCGSSRPRRCAAPSRTRPSSTRIRPSRTCGCTRTPARSRRMRRAIAISEGALAATLAAAAAGMSEAEVARRLVAEMLDAGADGLAFDPIVLAGAGLRRPARRPEPRPPPGAGHAAADRLRRGLRRLHGRHHPHRLRRISRRLSTATSTRRSAPPTRSAAASPRRR